MTGSEVTITPKGEGTATVTVTATNSRGQSAKQTIDVTVTVPSPPALDPPGIRDTFADVRFAHDATASRPLTLSNYFARATSYEVMEGNTAIATASDVGGVLSITPVASGSTYVRVTAVNDSGQISQTITVVVMMAPAMVPPTGTHQVLIDNLDSGDDGMDSMEFVIDLIAEGYILGRRRAVHLYSYSTSR